MLPLESIYIFINDKPNQAYNAFPCDFFFFFLNKYIFVKAFNSFCLSSFLSLFLSRRTNVYLE